MSGEWIVRADSPASPEAIAGLIAICPIALPQSYLDLLAESDGAEAGLAVDPLWLVIYPVEEVVGIATSGAFREAYPNLFIFGGSGGSDAFAFDLSPERPGGISVFDTAAEDPAQSVRPVADSFDALLAQIDT